MVIWAVVQSHISNRPKGQPDVPAYLIQGLDPADIGSIILGTGEDAVTLKRHQGGFMITNKDNYPAVTSEINELITSCLDIRTIELYTDDKANHEALGVTEEEAQKIVKFLKPDSSLLTGIVMGKSKEQGQGSFVRLVSSDKVYVTLQPPWISDQVMNYIDQELISVNRDDIESVTVSCPNEVYTLKRNKEDDSIILENLPEDKKLKDNAPEQAFTALTNLRFNDVKKTPTAEKDLSFDRQFVCRLKDSTVYTIKIAREDDKSYITCDAEFTDKTPVMKEQAVESEEQLKKKEAKLLAQDKAEEFSARHQGWIYEIAEWKAKNLTKRLSELLEDKESFEETAQVNEPNSVNEK
jgi:hypothetical protein